MVLVEFLGVPGVGKTTLADGVAKELRARRREAVFLPMDRMLDLSRWADRARHLLGIARYGWARPRQAWRSASVARIFPQPTMTEAVKILGYWLATHQLAHEHARRAEIVVLDQGYCQGIYSWALQSPALDPVVLRRALALAPMPDVVIAVSAPVAVIRARLEQRGHTHKLVDRLLSDDQRLHKSVDLVARIEQAVREMPCLVVGHEGSTGTSVEDSVAQIVAALGLHLPSGRSSPPDDRADGAGRTVR
jgi:thymidylate kinase